MSTQPYARFPRELLLVESPQAPDIHDEQERTDVHHRVAQGTPAPELQPITPMVKPRAIAALVANNPSAIEVRPLTTRASAPQVTLLGIRTPKSLTAQVPQPAQPGQPERPVRMRAMGTPSPVSLFGGAPPVAQAQAQQQAQETVLMPHAQHDQKLQETIAMVQQAQAQAAQTAAIVMQQPASPAPQNVVVAGELAIKDAKAKGKYTEYEQMGLADPAKAEPKPGFVAKGAAKLVVSMYRLVGFGILTLIVAVLVGYITTTAFYFVSHTWIVPTVVSPSDDKVVQLRTELAAQQNVRDKIEADLHETERAALAEGEFQAEFADAIKADLDGRKVALGRVQQLAGAAYSTRQKIASSNDSYAKEVAATSAKELEAGLIDKQHAMSANFTVAQISDAQLRLQQSEIQFSQQATELKAQTDALDALLATPVPGAKRKALSYDVLKIKRDYDASKQALAKAVEAHKMLVASLARQDEILVGLRQSAYLRALDDKAVVALVPYGNLENAKPGTVLFACKVNMVWCHEVGSVLAVLPGEIQFKNPHRDANVRGQMVELKLTDGDAATDEVLFVGGEPMGF